MNDLITVAYEALEYFEDRQDVIDGDYGIPEPNKEMRLADALRRAIARAEGE